MHMIFACAATKDVLFAGAFTWMMALAMEMVSQKQDVKCGRKCAALLLCGTLSCLLRNNMIYALAVWLVWMLAYSRRRFGKLTLVALAIVALTLGVNKTLQWSTNAQDGDAREMLSMPIQQIARVCSRKPECIEPDERALIDAAFSETIRWSDYDPTISDLIKDRLNTETVKKNLSRYIEMYIALARRCPNVFLDAAVELTLPYIYPYHRYDWSRALIETQTKYAEFEDAAWKGCLEESARFRRVRNWLAEHFWTDGADGIPVVRWLFNTGLMAWLMLFFVLREAYAGRYRRLEVCLLPVLAARPLQQENDGYAKMEQNRQNDRCSEKGIKNET